MSNLQLEEIVDRIESAFGDAPALTATPLADYELPVMERLLNDEHYQAYLQDQHNRQIIRDYLTNAVALGIITQDRLVDFAERVASEEGRSAMSLQMLMSSVEEAESLAMAGALEPLTPLEPAPDSPPFMKLVP